LRQCPCGATSKPECRLSNRMLLKPVPTQGIQFREGRPAVLAGVAHRCRRGVDILLQECELVQFSIARMPETHGQLLPALARAECFSARVK
jgi:hypothetical protein